jgi:hypothetical protein
MTNCPRNIIKSEQIKEDGLAGARTVDRKDEKITEF